MCRHFWVSRNDSRVCIFTVDLKWSCHFVKRPLKFVTELVSEPESDSVWSNFLFVNTASDSFRNSLLNSTDEKITSSAEKVDKRTFESLYNLNQLKSSWHQEGCLTWMGSNQIPFIRGKTSNNEFVTIRHRPFKNRIRCCSKFDLLIVSRKEDLCRDVTPNELKRLKNSLAIKVLKFLVLSLSILTACRFLGWLI